MVPTQGSWTAGAYRLSGDGIGIYDAKGRRQAPARGHGSLIGTLTSAIVWRLQKCQMN